MWLNPQSNIDHGAGVCPEDEILLSGWQVSNWKARSLHSGEVCRADYYYSVCWLKYKQMKCKKLTTQQTENPAEETSNIKIYIENQPDVFRQKGWKKARYCPSGSIMITPLCIPLHLSFSNVFLECILSGNITLASDCTTASLTVWRPLLSS